MLMLVAVLLLNPTKATDCARKIPKMPEIITNPTIFNGILNAASRLVKRAAAKNTMGIFIKKMLHYK